jgi:hypothetical protein
VTTALNATYQKVVTLGQGLLLTAIATGLLLGWIFGQIGWPLLLGITESSGKIDWIATVLLGKLPSIILLTILILRMTFLRASTANELNVQPSGVDTIAAAAWVAIKVWVAHIAAFLIALRFGLEISDIGNGSASFEAIIHDANLFDVARSLARTVTMAAICGWIFHAHEMLFNGFKSSIRMTLFLAHAMLMAGIAESLDTYLFF